MSELPARTEDAAVAGAANYLDPAATLRRRVLAGIAYAMHPELGPDRLVVAGPFEQGTIAQVCDWLEGRTGYNGGGFSSADDVCAAIRDHFGKPVSVPS